MTHHICGQCREPALVQHELDESQRLCLTHATEHICDCGHTAAMCPIAGCGTWISTTAEAMRLLMLDFHFIITPDTMRH